MFIESMGIIQKFFVYDYTLDEKYEKDIINNPKISHMQINREYMPYKALIIQSTYVANRDESTHTLEGNTKIINEEKINLRDEIQIKDGKKGDILEFPYYFYVGYEITIDNDKKINKPIETENGYLGFELQEDIEEGVITVEYKGTLLQKISYIISSIGVICFIIYIIYEKVKWRKQ